MSISASPSEVEHVVLVGGLDRRAAQPHVGGADQQ
jgi:hypothetical protein